MTKLFYDSDADVGRLAGRRVAIVGYGSQGHAHALNLRDSGVDVVVGLREDSSSRTAVQKVGLRVATVDEAADQSQIVMILTPDTGQARLYCDHIQRHLGPGKTLMFAHGFAIHWGTVKPPADVDVSMIAPKAPGHRVREVFQQGGGVPALVAVHQDASGHALDDALGYAKALGCTRAGVLETTFEEETETDLFGEQAVLCGGVSALVKAGFDTLVDAGYQPEVAYFECMHELKLIVDLLHEGGLKKMHQFVSETAKYGDLTRGPRIIDEHVRESMRKVLKEVQDGTFAKQWIEENKAGQPNYKRLLQEDLDQGIEKVGKTLRGRMSWLQE